MEKNTLTTRPAVGPGSEMAPHLIFPLNLLFFLLWHWILRRHGQPQSADICLREVESEVQLGYVLAGRKRPWASPLPIPQ